MMPYLFWALSLLLACDGRNNRTGETDPETDFIINEGLFQLSCKRADERHPRGPGTVFVVDWRVSLEAVDDAYIRFGRDASYGARAETEDSGGVMRTVLLGLKPGREYHFQLAVSKGGTLYHSEDHTIETGPATNLLTIDEFDVKDAAAREPGFIVLVSRDIAAIFDSDGEPVWWYRSPLGDLFSARMSYDARSMWLIPRVDGFGGGATGPLERVTMDTYETEVYDDVASSHDLTPVTGDVMAFIDYGSDRSARCANQVLEIDTGGRTRTIFDASDYLRDCHLNAVRYNEIEDIYTISDRGSTIYMVSRSGDLRWKLSDVVDHAEYGGAQHGHHLLEESILVFANEAVRDRSIVYEFGRKDGAVRSVYSASERSGTLGSVQRLPGGNMLVTYSNAGAIHEVAPDGRRVLEIQTDFLGYANWRASLYGPPDDVTY